MPRGKNYVNNNQGVSMLASKKKKAPSMEQCFYGKGCTRESCFYRHDGPVAGGGEKSAEPCMPFLAGLCTFSSSGCRKRHPGKAEAERLVAKYKQMRCRYGQHCKTAGCLYIHPDDENNRGSEDAKLSGAAAFPPLGGTNVAPRPVAGAWKPMQPTGGTPSKVPPVTSAWQPSPPPAPVWGQGRNPVLANHTSPPAPMNGTVPTMNGMVCPPDVAAAAQPAMDQSEALSPRASGSLNINAKEFVPGMF